MRSFVGLPLPDDLAEDLERRAATVQAGRVVPAENLHLTLAFLGDQTLQSLTALDAELVMIRAEAPRLRWGPPDFFGGTRTRVFALTVEPDPALMVLQARVVRAARLAGVMLPAARFRPHVTVIRLNPEGGARQQGRLQDLILSGRLTGLPDVMADTLTLYRSHLRESGARYERLADYPLDIIPAEGA